MRYDGQNPLHARQAMERLEKLIRDGKIFDLTEKKPQRSRNQNNYLWTLLAYWGTQTGYTKDEAETLYKDLNADIYHTSRDICGRRVAYVRHTYELSTAEMSLTLDRWRNWSSAECGIYLPAPEDFRLLELAELEIERNKEYL